MDFLSCSAELRGFDVCIDKGTYDAISLNPDKTEEGKGRYVQALRDALKEGGFFIITSCNWTKDQLLQRFSEGERRCGDIIKMQTSSLIGKLYTVTTAHPWLQNLIVQPA